MNQWTPGEPLFHVVDPRQFDRPRLEGLVALTEAARAMARTREGALALQQRLAHRRAMLYFTQPSTRTFLSFNNPCHVLGMVTSEIRDPSTSSEVKGETIEDSIRTFSAYVDVIIMRTWAEGLASRMARLMDTWPRPVPIVNAGSGRDLHPTQGLLDIYTLHLSFAKQGGIDGKVIGFMGDLRRGRTVRSLCYLLANYREVSLGFIAPEPFTLGDDIKAYLTEHGVPFWETDDLHQALPQLDAIYVTRLQSEHDAPGEASVIDYQRFSIGLAEMARLKPNGVVMHPLPRGAELATAVDSDPRATYWRLERNGMWLRVALLLTILGEAQGFDGVPPLA
ncbi:MAG: aspartate carbamoyltransferase [Candidatus Competibacterales bacterium]